MPRSGDKFAGSPVFFRLGGKPLTIWSGIWAFSVPDVARVTGAVRPGLLVLATEKDAAGFQRVADLTDGDAYYWSSVNPATYPGYGAKLNQMGNAIHRDGKYWIAPFAPGFDARMVGGARFVPRRGGQTLRTEYATALRSSPDVLGLISWNEFSENTHAEPSIHYRFQSLDTLRQLRSTSVPALAGPAAPSDDGSGRPGSTASTAVYVGNLLRLAGFPIALVAAVALLAFTRRRARAHPTGRRRVSRAGAAPRNAPAPEGTMITSPVRRTIAVLLGAAALSVPALTAGSPALASLPGRSSLLTRAPYLTDLTTSSVQVSWGTSAQFRGVVQYGPAGNCTAQSVTSATLGSPITINGVKEYQNSVAVTGLAPATAYCYRVTTGGTSPVDLLGTEPSPQFRTLQLASGTAPVTFAVLGDWGDTTNSGVNNGSVNANQAGVDAQIAASGAQFAISTGDTAYPGGTQTSYGDLSQTGPNISAVFGPSYWAKPGESIPHFVVSGNHGLNSTFLTNWPQPATVAASGGTYGMTPYPSIDGTAPANYPTSYYAFSTGGARFYLLDASWGNSNTGDATGGTCGSKCAMYQVDHDAHWSATSAEYQWLRHDLAAHPGGLKFAFFHFPLYTNNSTEVSDPYLDNTPGSTGSLEQLLNSNGVQLVFNGHAHIYERNIATPGGVTNYVSGGGGAKAEPVSNCTSADAYAIGWSYSKGKGSACGSAAAPASDSQVYHFLKVTVNGTTVTVAPTDATGHTFDVQTTTSRPTHAAVRTGQPDRHHRHPRTC